MRIEWEAAMPLPLQWRLRHEAIADEFVAGGLEPLETARAAFAAPSAGAWWAGCPWPAGPREENMGPAHSSASWLS